MARRGDIQGLRAIAVVVVVLFHSGLPVPGGFIGVDVFFVISGFVITGMLHREWSSTGRIRFRRFYLRRFKRLTPALALVTAVTIAVSLVLLSPFGPQQTATKTGIGAMLLSANVVITKTTGDYFAAPATGNPLLHTWSLSVEEQFYLVFPLILLVGWWASALLRRRWLLAAIIAAGSVASFTLATLALGRPLGPTESVLFGFYGPAGRAWEFAVGALLFLAVPAPQRLPRWTGALTGVLGAGLLLFSLFAISESSPFPGPWTLLPVAATLLLLASGLHDSPVRRGLASWPMAKVGDWSYSIYLWHWPLIVFAMVLWPGARSATIAAAALSVLPAAASYRWVETPLRLFTPRNRSGTLAVVFAVVVPVLVFSTAALSWSSSAEAKQAATARFDGEIAWRDHDYTSGGFNDCTDPVLHRLVADGPNHEPRCQQSKPGADVDLAVIGDSHAEHLFIGLMDALPHRNILYFTANAGFDPANPQYAAALDYARRTASIRTVLITTFWRQRGVPRAALEAGGRRLAAGGVTVLFTDDVPNFPFDPYGCLYPAPLTEPRCALPRSEFMAGHRGIEAELRRVQRAVPHSRLLHTVRYLCDDTLCGMTRGREIFYADPSHLNVLGSRYVGRRLVEDYPALR